MKWILNTYQTTQEWDIDRIIAVCQTAGYQGIEFLQDFGQRHGLEADASDEHADAIAERMRAAGLIIGSLTSCCAFHSPYEAERQRSITQVKQVIAQAARMGCDHVRVLGDQVPDDERSRGPVLANVAAALHELARTRSPAA